MSFRTSFINEKTGAEITDVVAIARQYLKGQFTIDVLATLPFDTIGAIFGKGQAFKVFGALKLVRVLRLNKIITYLRSTEEFKAFLKLNKLVFLLVMYLHCFGCGWWMIVSMNEEWIPTMNYNDDDYYFVYAQDIKYKYFVSLHAAVLLVTGNDVGPRDTLQVIVGSIGLFLGAIINANIFGELAVLVSQLNAKSTEFQTKLTKINTTIKNLKLPRDLEDKIRDYIITNQSALEGQEELSRFMKLLSPSIKAEVIKHEFYDVVEAQKMFGGKNEDIINDVLEKLSLNLYKPDESICTQGEYPKEMFFLCRGNADVYKTFDSAQPYFIASLEAGKMFGEIAAVLQCRSSATV